MMDEVDAIREIEEFQGKRDPITGRRMLDNPLNKKFVSSEELDLYFNEWW